MKPGVHKGRRGAGGEVRSCFKTSRGRCLRLTAAGGVAPPPRISVPILVVVTSCQPPPSAAHRRAGDFEKASRAPDVHPGLGGESGAGSNLDETHVSVGFVFGGSRGLGFDGFGKLTAGFAHHRPGRLENALPCGSRLNVEAFLVKFCLWAFGGRGGKDGGTLPLKRQRRWKSGGFDGVVEEVEFEAELAGEAPAGVEA
jgi:hypothetical protein